ncbi:MAG: sulfatase-like hydrolase/transferase, partial [Myxococcota bacterium]
MIAISLALLGCTSLPGRAPRPSVLLVTLDTTRADHLGPYGASFARTPTLDRLAADGATFLRAYASCPLTIPSHSTILTGRYPPAHGVHDNGAFLLGDAELTLAERLHDAGWHTLAVTSAFPTQRRWGFGQGFDVYHDPLTRRPTQLDWSDQRRADEVVDDVIASLAAIPDDGRPVFAWVHLFDAHWPYDPPPAYADTVPGRPYDGEIAFADHELGRLLAAWDGRSAGRPSLVVVTADHGEGLGDGGELTHGFLLHDGTVHVPLLVRGPGFAPGARPDGPVSHVDLVPTVLGVVGVPGDDRLQGRDLRDGGSGEAYSEARTGQYQLGLAPLAARTTAAGRYTRGAWGATYPANGDRVDVRGVRVPDDGADARALDAAIARIGAGTAPEAPADPEVTAMLEALGYAGSDPAAPAGDIDPRDVIDVIPLTWRARQALGAHHPDQADALIGRLERRMPGTIGVDRLRADWLRATGRPTDAHRLLADVYDRAPSGEVALSLGDLDAALGRWADAAGWYDEAYRLDPASPRAMAGRARSAQMLGDPASAEELAAAFLAVYPDHAELELILAELQLADGAPREALAGATDALDGLPDSAWAHRVYGEAAWALGRPDPAIDALQEALRLDPYPA